MTSKPINERATFDAWTVSRGRVVGYQGWREDFEIWKARALLAAPEAPRQDNSALMKIAADLANRTPLRQLYLVCDTQSRIGVESLHEYLDKCGDLLAGTALDIRRAITSQAATLSPDHSGGGAGVVLQVCKIGIYGKAYDSPETKRAYTFDDQPGNVEAHKLGQAVNLAALSPGGDLIDQGLSLLRALSGEGFGVFEIDKVKELDQ